MGKMSKPLEKHVVYRPIENDIVFANFRRTDDNLIIMQGDPYEVTRDCIKAVAEEMLNLNKSGMDHVVMLNGKEYRMMIMEESIYRTGRADYELIEYNPRKGC